MGNATPLIIYVVVMILGAIVRKIAEDRAQQKKMSTGPEESHSYDVTMENILNDEADVSEGIPPTGLEMSVDDGEDGLEELDLNEGWEDDEWERAYQPDTDDEETPNLPARPNWAQAIVMSEIISQPRARRRWPSRR